MCGYLTAQSRETVQFSYWEVMYDLDKTQTWAHEKDYRALKLLPWLWKEIWVITGIHQSGWSVGAISIWENQRTSGNQHILS
jgi:hypothetical protein